MPSLNLTDKTLRYAASDETVLDKAATLLGVMAEYDGAAKQDAVTALAAVRHLREHVHGTRVKAKPAT